MGFFSTPPGYKPADSLTISLATAAGVLVIYSSKIGPAADVQASLPGDPSVNSAIKKAGWESWLLVAAMTLLSRDLNVAILGGAAVILEHVMYLHSEMASPSTGQIEASPEAYQPAGVSAGANISLVALTDVARQIDGIALGAIGAGALFLYAGATNRSVLRSVQALIQGSSPAAAPQNLFPAAGPPPGSPAPGGTAGGRGAGSGGAAWSAALLAAAGFPQTQANITSVSSWQAREGGGGQNNPLNTTQVMPGSTNFNNLGGGQGVQNYVSVAQGIAATVKTLNNGSYGDIVMLLRSGSGLCGHTLAGLATWSGKGYSSVC